MLMRRIESQSIRSKAMTWAEPAKRPSFRTKDDGKSNKSPPAPIEDDDVEDGDFATPKRDRSDPDDEPL